MKALGYSYTSTDSGLTIDPEGTHGILQSQLKKDNTATRLVGE